jgi:SET domain-containing protein
MKKRIQVRRSGLHGRGVFALADIAKGERIIEYKGEIISNDEADERHPVDPGDPFHTFFFSLDDGICCIDGGVQGNSARWINHHCAPNCDTEEKDDARGRSRVYVFAKRDIAAGEELTYDYRLQLGTRPTKQDKRNYRCLCGARDCRGTMLSLDAPVRKKKK